MSTLYHVRHPNGTSIDMTESKSSALKAAQAEHAEVYELRAGIAKRIYTPPVIKPVRLES